MFLKIDMLDQYIRRGTENEDKGSRIFYLFLNYIQFYSKRTGIE